MLLSIMPIVKARSPKSITAILPVTEKNERKDLIVSSFSQADYYHGKT